MVRAGFFVNFSGFMAFVPIHWEMARYIAAVGFWLGQGRVVGRLREGLAGDASGWLRETSGEGVAPRAGLGGGGSGL